MADIKLYIGIDIGSTTAKTAVVDPQTKEIIWSKYIRHETKQPEFTRDLLVEICEAYPDVKHEEMRVFMTGSGSGPITPHVGV